MDTLGGFFGGIVATLIVLYWMGYAKEKSIPHTPLLPRDRFNPQQGAIKTILGGVRIVSPTYPDGEILPALIAAEEAWQPLREEVKRYTQEMVAIATAVEDGALPNPGMGTLAVMSCLLDILSAEHLFKIRHGVDVKTDNGVAIVCAYTLSGRLMTGGVLQDWVQPSFCMDSTKNA